MRVQLPLSVNLQTPEPASKYIPSILARISADFEGEGRGSIQRGATEFVFSRNISQLPFSNDRLGLFDDGRFSVTARENLITINGELGMKIGGRAGLLCLGAVVLAFVTRDDALLFPIILGLTIIGTLILILVRLWSTRQWVKNIAKSAILAASTAR